MFSSSHYWWECVSYFRSWINQIWDSVDLYRASLRWQTPEGLTTTATVEDGDRPEEKPRPPAGGQSFVTNPSQN